MTFFVILNKKSHVARKKSDCFDFALNRRGRRNPTGGFSITVAQHADAAMIITQQLVQKVLRKTSVLRDRTAINNGEHEVTLKIARTMPQDSIVRNTAMKKTGLTEDDLA
ncbi:TPA: hypothetical protein MJG23_23305 [Klebsiella pneumoniae]|nr:hypothetical protein [Klebsiella pneumoniae]